MPCLLSLLLALFPFDLLAQEPGQLELEELPFEVRTAEGRLVDALAGRLTVVDDRRAKESRTIALRFALLRGGAPEGAAPIVYLHGGPGGSTAGDVKDPGAMSRWEPFLELGNVILLDQRGCGRSVPELSRALSEPPPPEIFRSDPDLAAFMARAGRAVRAELEAEGVAWRAYDTEQSADDVAALCLALGVERVRLVGFSYGTHLGLSILRRHPEIVESAVLVGVEGPDETLKLPDAYTTQLAKLAAMVAADPATAEDVPDLVALCERVLAKLAAEPLAVEVRQPLTDEPVVVRVGRDGLARILVRDLGDTNDLNVIPRLLWTVERGDGSLLRWFVQKRYGSGRYPTHMFSVDAASGVDAERARRIEREAAECPLGNAMNWDLPGLDAVWPMPDLGPAFRAPFACTVCTLFVSGDLDANTPPYQAERMRSGFVDATHLVQANGGHEDWLRNPAALRAMRDFLAGEAPAPSHPSLAR